ncbi:MAG TPA: GNAT family protein [Longimicrobiaceae bacterium]|nr:GNAT family protein [Longimicrobiaceae bacterium]
MILHTERLLLREITEDDGSAVLAYQRHPLFSRYYHWSERTEADVRLFLQQFLEWQEEEPRSKFSFAITLEGTMIGIASLRRPTSEAPLAEIGYELSPEHWGRGYAREAAGALLEFGFGELGLHRLGAHCVAENTASARVLEKVGMLREGRLRENEFFKERWWDTLLYGILAREWTT